MARPLRIEFPGALYHITFRGNAKQNIFFDEKDFTGFLAILEDRTRDGSLFLFTILKPFIYKAFRPSSGMP